MNKEEIQEIQELKNSQRVYRFTDEDNNSIGLLILNRGEQMFYQENDNGLICEISARHSVIFTKSIKKWSNGKKINPEEKNKIIERLKKYYKNAYQDEVSFSDS